MPSPARLESHRDMRCLHPLLRFRLTNDATVAHNSGCSSCSTLHRDVNDRVGATCHAKLWPTALYGCRAS
jgi:hypothetical protein